MKEIQTLASGTRSAASSFAASGLSILAVMAWSVAPGAAPAAAQEAPVVQGAPAALDVATVATPDAARGAAGATAPASGVAARSADAVSALADAINRAGEQMPPFSLTDVIFLTLRNNPQRGTARSAVAAARARVGTARSAGGPQVGLSGSLNADRSFGRSSSGGFSGGNFGGGGNVGGNPGGGNPGGGNPGGGNPGGNPGGGNQGGNGGAGGSDDSGFLGFSNNQSLGVSAQLPIYSGGRVRAGTRAAQSALQAQAALALQTDQDLVLDTITSYLNILRTGQLLEVADSNLVISRERLRVAQVRFEAGASARLDVLRADTTLADALQRRIAASNTFALAKAGLNSLIGRPPETPLRVEPVTGLGLRVPLPGEAGETAPAATPSGAGAAPGAPIGAPIGARELADIGKLRELADRYRPALESARAQVRTAEANVDVAKAQRKPSVDLSLSGFLRNPVTFAGRFALGLGLGIAQTLFDSGRARSQIAEAQALAEQSRQGLRNQRSGVSDQIGQALLTLYSAQGRERSADTAVVSALEAVRAAQLGYEAGTLTALDVSDAQNALLLAQTEAVNARFDVATAQAQLSAAVGLLTEEGQAAYRRALQEEQARQGQGDAAGRAADTAAPKKRRRFLGIF